MGADLPAVCEIIKNLTVAQIDALPPEQKALIRSCGFLGTGGGGERGELAKVERAFREGGYEAAIIALENEVLPGAYRVYGYNRLQYLKEKEVSRHGTENLKPFR